MPTIRENLVVFAKHIETLPDEEIKPLKEALTDLAISLSVAIDYKQGVATCNFRDKSSLSFSESSNWRAIV